VHYKIFLILLPLRTVRLLKSHKTALKYQFGIMSPCSLASLAAAAGIHKAKAKEEAFKKLQFTNNFSCYQRYEISNNSLPSLCILSLSLSRSPSIFLSHSLVVVCTSSGKNHVRNWVFAASQQASVMFLCGKRLSSKSYMLVHVLLCVVCVCRSHWSFG